MRNVLCRLGIHRPTKKLNLNVPFPHLCLTCYQRWECSNLYTCDHTGHDDLP